jgi:hypothetical protein
MTFGCNGSSLVSTYGSGVTGRGDFKKVGVKARSSAELTTAERATRDQLETNGSHRRACAPHGSHASPPSDTRHAGSNASP